MIANQLMDYLKFRFPQHTDRIFKYPSDATAPQNKIVVRLTEGIETNISEFNINIQITVQDRDSTICANDAYAIYNVLKFLNDFDLPAIPGRETTDPAFHIAQIKPMQLPIDLGDIGNGIYMYSVNFQIKGNEFVE